MIIPNREYMESTVSDKVSELETQQKQNQNNLITLLRTVAYYHDKATRLEETWKLSHAVRVLALLKYTFYPLFILYNGMNLISKSLTVLTPA